MAKIEYQVYQRSLGRTGMLVASVDRPNHIAGEVNGPDICAISIKAIEDDGSLIPIAYAVRQEGKGWSSIAKDGGIAGEETSTAPRIDKIKISMQHTSYNIMYSVHSKGVDWFPNRKPTIVLSFTIGKEDAGGDNC